MSNITASMVKDLRDKTGAGMMDCKVALGETNGDAEAAIDWLRKKGLMKAAKKAGRVAAEGLVGVAVGGDTGALVEVNSETDFVARNDQFKEFVKTAAEIALQIDGDLEKLLAQPMGNASVQDELTGLIAKIGENMSVRRVAALAVKPGVRCVLCSQRDLSRTRQDWRARRPQIRRRYGETFRVWKAACDACCRRLLLWR